MKTLKIWNGSSLAWSEGHMYVAAYSLADAVRMVNAAYRKVMGYEEHPEINPVGMSYARKMWSPNCWGNAMEGITPERGVWFKKRGFSNEKPERII